MFLAPMLAAALLASDCKDGSCRAPSRLVIRVPAFAASVPLPVAPIAAVPVVPVPQPAYVYPAVVYPQYKYKYKVKWYYPRPVYRGKWKQKWVW